MNNTSISLIELESFDPRYSKFGNEKRFCCPFCGHDKPKDKAHQSLAANINTGAWLCHRCQEKGLLKEFWTRSNGVNKMNNDDFRRKALQSKFEIKSSFSESKAIDSNAQEKISYIRSRYEALRSAFPTSPAVRYLESRGISEELAIASNCGYVGNWKHGDGEDQRVIFPIHDRNGELVAIAARAIDDHFIEPKSITNGAKRLGVFATPNALEAEIIVIVEAPIDALSLAIIGLPSIAIIGTSWADWLIKHCALKTVALATDADLAGDEAANKLSIELKKLAANPIRLRPVEAKDWNECLMTKGIDFVKAEVSRVLRIKLESSLVNEIEIKTTNSNSPIVVIPTNLPTTPKKFNKEEFLKRVLEVQEWVENNPTVEVVAGFTSVKLKNFVDSLVSKLKKGFEQDFIAIALYLESLVIGLGAKLNTCGSCFLCGYPTPDFIRVEQPDGLCHQCRKSSLKINTKTPKELAEQIEGFLCNQGEVESEIKPRKIIKVNLFNDSLAEEFPFWHEIEVED